MSKETYSAYKIRSLKSVAYRKTLLETSSKTFIILVNNFCSCAI